MTGRRAVEGQPLRPPSEHRPEHDADRRLTVPMKRRRHPGPRRRRKTYSDRTGRQRVHRLPQGCASPSGWTTRTSGSRTTWTAASEEALPTRRNYWTSRAPWSASDCPCDVRASGFLGADPATGVVMADGSADWPCCRPSPILPCRPAPISGRAAADPDHLGDHTESLQSVSPSTPTAGPCTAGVLAPEHQRPPGGCGSAGPRLSTGLALGGICVR